MERLSSQAHEALVLDYTDLNSLYSRLRDIFVMYNNLDEALTKALLSDQPLQVLLNHAADFFQNPVRAFDADLALIESSNNCPYAENDLVWKEISSTGMASTIISNRLKSRQQMQALYKSEKAVFIDVGKDFARSIAVNCFSEKERFAILTVSGSKTYISPQLLGLADHIAERLTPALLKYCGPKSYKRSQTVAYISGLLYGQQVDLQIMDARLKNIGWKKNDKYLVLRVKLPYQNFMEGIDGYNKKYYASFFKDSLSFLQEDIVNIILNISGKEEAILKEIETMEISLIRDGALCGISLAFQDFSMLHEHYLLAGIALNSGKLCNTESPYRYYRDCMLSHLLGELSGIMPLRALCNEAVLRIQEHDDLHGSPFVISLLVYLQEERSLVKAAKALNIHRNTLVYRLERISEIAKIDFNDTNLRMHILFSCVLLQHIKSST